MIRKITSILFMLMISLLFINCTKEDTKYILVDNLDEYTKQVNLEKYEVEFLFEVDGVKMYRFHDGGMSRYFTIGNDKVISSPHSEYNAGSEVHEKIEDAVIQGD